MKIENKFELKTNAYLFFSPMTLIVSSRAMRHFVPDASIQESLVTPSG